MGPTGRSYAFDKRAEGYGRGEGVVTLVLKTLAKAEADGDAIHAVIRGSASNQDGKTATITSPSEEAQAALIADCYAVAGLDPRETAFVECHGTGTKVGDLCEASAVHTSFQTDSRRFPLYLGSVKSNIGHLEAASGLASIIKVIKAFQNGTIPPNYDFTDPSSTIPWSEWHLAVRPPCDVVVVFDAHANLHEPGSTRGRPVAIGLSKTSLRQQLWLRRRKCSHCLRSARSHRRACEWKSERD